MPFDRKIFFDSVRKSLFAGSMTQQQVDGMNYKLDQWELHHPDKDLRWLSYPFATSYHETSATMWPIEEYGKGAGQPYGVPDPETKQTYYGRGDVQLTWRDNYRKATQKLMLSGAQDLEWNASQALDPKISADVMYLGMQEGWFRSDSKGRQTLARYFNATTNDAYGAREIINGDKTKVPSWSGGISIGNLIKGYNDKFLTAMKAAWVDAPEPEPEPEPVPEPTTWIDVDYALGVGQYLRVRVNGDIVYETPTEPVSVQWQSLQRSGSADQNPDRRTVEASVP